MHDLRRDATLPWFPCYVGRPDRGRTGAASVLDLWRETCCKEVMDKI